MMLLHKLIATFFGIGYLQKGAGTIAAIICCILWFLIPAGWLTATRQVFIVLFINLIGVWSSNAVDNVWGKDSNRVVIDEVGGMLISLLLVPVKIRYILTALLLFRFFDIAKPLFIKQMEALPKGWGVMADDALAAIYARIVLQLILSFSIF